MDTAEFAKPATIYMTTDAVWACSERDPYAPQNTTVYWVDLDGGKVTADVFDPAKGADTMTHGDPWTYGVETGLTMTAVEMAEALVA